MIEGRERGNSCGDRAVEIEGVGEGVGGGFEGLADGEDAEEGGHGGGECRG